MDVSVRWLGAHRFEATTPSGVRVSLDGDGREGASPTETALIAIAACMGIDIVDILTKGRQPPKTCVIDVHAERRESPPRRFTRIALTISLTGGDIQPHKAERAVELSRDTYCSVWNSMAPDITLETEVRLQGENPPG